MRTITDAGNFMGKGFAVAEMPLPCISHDPTVEARDTTARASLRLLAVLNVLFKYACARQAARASS
ncbi:MAG: hypothetical protein OXI93_07085 [Bryobacterales bacterium]|nr:hypothetical protein [Bryobacterales bacterium]